MEELSNYAGNLQENQNKTIFCSLPMDTPEERKLAFNVMASPDFKISDAVNLPLDLKHLFCETANVTDTKTGELKEMPRVVLVTKEGKSYQSVSFGIYNAISRLIAVYGPPPWEPPIAIVVKKVGKGDKQTYSINLR